MFSFPFLFLFCPIRLYKDLDAFMDKWLVLDVLSLL
jgi:hypothetical protein